MDTDLYCEDFRPYPYWWDDVAPLDENHELPSKTDVLIIGGGYTGMSAALELARRGREVVVLESETIGWGCSSRNGGQVSDGVKPDFNRLARAHGRESAHAIIAEAKRALSWLDEFIEAEKIACEFRRCGRFHGAHTPSAYEALANEVADRSGPGGVSAAHAKGAYMISRSEQKDEIGTDAYFGGAVFPEHFSVHPAKLHHGLAVRALAAGAQMTGHCAALKITKGNGGFRISTRKGEVDCRQVILATNGYTNTIAPLSRWHSRRIIPIGSYIIATEPLEDGILKRLLPKDRVISDTRNVIYYYRASPDGKRMIFGGRVSCRETNPLNSAPLLHREMSRLFPDLAGTRITHSWCGFVGFTFDRLMHTGCREGIYFAMGYCGSGVALSIYLGKRIAQRSLGDRDGRTAFDGLSFRSAPFYTGLPWFLSTLLAYYRWRDSLG